MFERILIPVDFSERNQAAIETAGRLAQSGKSRLTLLHVIETIEHIPFDEMRDFYDRLERKAEENMKKALKETALQGKDVETKIVFGKRHLEIVRFAMESQADLIVMSSRRVDEHPPTGHFGAISHRVAVLAPCAVLLVK